MRVGHRFRSDAPGLSSTDSNDRFMRSLCAQWGARILYRYPRLDQETLEFVIWVLDPSTNILVRALADIGVEVDTILQEAPATPEGQAAALTSILCRPGTSVQTCHTRALAGALEGLVSSESQSDVARGLLHIKRTYGLSEDECALSFFLASVSAWPHLERFFDSHLECDRPSGRKYLMAALDMSLGRLRQAISGKLARIGILDVSHTWLSLDSDYAPLFTDPSDNPLLADLHRAVPSPDLATGDLGVDPTDVSLMNRLLTSKGDSPVHVLLYGAPGTGKTTLAQGLIRENCLDGLEVMGRSEGTIKQRRGALEACLNMSTGIENRVVVIDEADRLLNTGSPWSDHGEKSDKAWLNDVLERRGLRCLWIVNDTSSVDPAVRRRIDFSLEMPLPDLRNRRTMLEHVLRHKRIKRHFSTDDIRVIARDYVVSPAVLAVAADTASLSQESSSACRKTYLKALDSQLRLAGEITPVRQARQDVFLRDGINTSVEFDTLVEMVRAYDERWRSHSTGSVLPPFNMLFHGAPGTGKSYTARHLADLIDRPVLVKRASDLLNPFVGMSEKSIAAAFAEARETESVLVIDEIDSFLYKREMAHRTWESNLVSEFLVQLELGPGLLIGTTNRHDSVDAAAVRRFALRSAFRYLTPSAFIATYRHMMRDLTSARLTPECERRLEGVRNGTSAGLAAIHRTLILTGAISTGHEGVVEEVVREFAGLCGAHTTVGVIGFKVDA